MAPSPLDNIGWNSLNGAHARFSAGGGTARRYAPGFPPIAGFASNDRPDFDALAPHCAPGEHIYVGGLTAPPPGDWEVAYESSAWQMLWHGGAAAKSPVDAPIVELTGEHVPQMLALIDAAKPGPFAARSRELGRYVGIFEEGELVAMAGERFDLGTLREISAVCTLPSHQGRGLARAVMLALIDGQLRRGATPFLHVDRDNARAHATYRRMGFRDHAEMPLHVVAKRPR
jgi:GNAT superfamily N-acetyltransferase